MMIDSPYLNYKYNIKLFFQNSDHNLTKKDVWKY